MKKHVYSVLGVPVSALNLDLAAQKIFAFIREGFRGYVCVAPVSTIMDCQDDSDYKRVVNNAAMVTPDGMPVVWLGRLAGHKQVSRTYGPELMPFICDHGRTQGGEGAEGIRHFFYGGNEAVLNDLMHQLNARYPGIEIAGFYSPPQQDVGAQESQEVIDAINQAEPDIIWVGLGSPKQDFWMANHRDRLEAPVMIGVGAAFDFVAGHKKQAPRWMRCVGLEWLFRLCCEPKRLWRRYLIGNTRFLFLVLKQLLTRGSIR